MSPDPTVETAFTSTHQEPGDQKPWGVSVDFHLRWQCHGLVPLVLLEKCQKKHTHTHTHTVKIYSLIKMQSFIIEGKNVQV